MKDWPDKGKRAGLEAHRTGGLILCACRTGYSLHLRVSAAYVFQELVEIRGFGVRA